MAPADAPAAGSGRRLPPVGRVLALARAGVALAVAGAIGAAAVVGAELDHQFVNETGGITLLSAAALVTGAVLFLLAFRARAGQAGRWTWLVIGLGMVLLALDELFEGHERLGRALDSAGSVGPFRRWDDVVVLAYAVPALVVLVAMLPVLLRHRQVLRLLAAGFVAYALHTLVDIVSEPRTTTSAIVEESFKLTSVTLLAVAGYAAWSTARRGADGADSGDGAAGQPSVSSEATSTGASPT